MEECPVCLENLEEEKTYKGECRHSICFTCAEQMIRRCLKLRCPICRTDYKILQTPDRLASRYAQRGVAIDDRVTFTLITNPRFMEIMQQNPNVSTDSNEEPGLVPSAGDRLASRYAQRGVGVDDRDTYIMQNPTASWAAMWATNPRLMEIMPQNQNISTFSEPEEDEEDEVPELIESIDIDLTDEPPLTMTLFEQPEAEHIPNRNAATNARRSTILERDTRTRSQIITTSVEEVMHDMLNGEDGIGRRRRGISEMLHRVNYVDFRQFESYRPLDSPHAPTIYDDLNS